MLLDEPNTFLDLKHQVELAELLRRLAQERGIGVLLASHDLNLAASFADRLILLNEGAVAAEGNAGRERLLCSNGRHTIPKQENHAQEPICLYLADEPA